MKTADQNRPVMRDRETGNEIEYSPDGATMADPAPTSTATQTPARMPRLRPGKFMGLDLCRDAPSFQNGGASGQFQQMLESRRSYQQAHDAIREMMFVSHGGSYMKGWWHDKTTGELLDQAYQVPIKIALIHSEASEALEADRKGEMDDKLPHRPGIEVELADILHRVFDLAGALNLDLAGAYVAKSRFNAVRKDHAVDTRNAANGKAY